MLTTTALYDSRLRWFEACSWKPTSEGLSSIFYIAYAQVIGSHLNLFLVRLRRTVPAPSVIPYIISVPAFISIINLLVEIAGIHIPSIHEDKNISKYLLSIIV